MSAKRPIWWFIATWFGSGLSPIVSGTAGSLAALPFAYIIQSQLGNVTLGIASIIIFLIGWWASIEYLKVNTDKKDPREIVVDEVAGQWLLLSFLPFTWQAYLVGFILFRAFDIVKPWPVSHADQKMDGALGVMLDDMLAGIYPVGVYWLLAHFLPEYAATIMSFLSGAHV